VTAPRPTIAQIAADQFRARRARAAEVVRNTGMTRHEAERHLRPWLAIACMVGAALPELDDLLADLRRTNGSGPHAMSDGAIRWLAAEEICPRATWAPILTRARNAAYGRWLREDTDVNLALAAGLQRIALALQHDVNGHHIPFYSASPAPQQAAA
jgi:hypothetical protein